MIFKSSVLQNTKISKDYLDGDYKLDYLNNFIGVQYAITNTVEDKIIGVESTDRLIKFTDLENLFVKFIEVLTYEKYTEFKNTISNKLVQNSMLFDNLIEKEEEFTRLNSEIFIYYIGIEWRKYFWDIIKDEIIYKEKYEICLGFIDPLKKDMHSISVDINSDNFEIEDVFFE